MIGRSALKLSVDLTRPLTIMTTGVGYRAAFFSGHLPETSQHRSRLRHLGRGPHRFISQHRFLLSGEKRWPYGHHRHRLHYCGRAHAYSLFTNVFSLERLEVFYSREPHKPTVNIYSATCLSFRIGGSGFNHHQQEISLR